MSAFKRLLVIIQFCKENSHGKRADLLTSFEEYFLVNGLLTEKQLQVLGSVVRGVSSELLAAESFEKQLGSFLKSSDAKNVFRLIG